jgi:hypothetical protein
MAAHQLRYNLVDDAGCRLVFAIVVTHRHPALDALLQGPHVAVRTFVDRTGVRWSVSELAAPAPPIENRDRRLQPRSVKRIFRKAKRLSTRPLALAALLFECATERRRLTPMPAEWQTLPDDELEDLLLRTTVAPCNGPA